MKKLLTTQLIVLAFVGICVFSFLPAVQVQGCKRKEHVNIRPIDDWVINNPFGVGVPWETAYVGGDGKGKDYWMWLDSLDGAFTGNQYEYSGHVKEKVLLDGSIEITVYLFVKDIYVELYNAAYDDNGDPVWTMEYFGDCGDLHSFGYADYFFRLEFTLDAEYEGYEQWGIPAGTREAGCMLPYFDAISYIPEEIGAHLKSLMLLGAGDLYTFEPGWRWPAPDEPWPDDATLDGGTAKIFFLECAEFDNPLGGGYPGWGYWPFGSSSDFFVNTIRVFNLKY